MTDKKKNTKKVGKSSGKKRDGDAPKAKVSVYQESLKRTRKGKVTSKRNIIRKDSKYLFLIGFFFLSFLLGRFIISDFFRINDTQVNLSTKCQEEVEFSNKEKEFLAISSMVNKPVINQQVVNPCFDEFNEKSSMVNKYFSEKNEQGTLLSVLKMDVEIRKRGKISNLSTKEETANKLEMRLKKLQNYSENFNHDYPRFKITDSFPENGLFYGLEFDEVLKSEEFLKSKRCDTPAFSYANDEISHLGLFFTLNAKRGYGGRVKTINNRYINLIEGEFSLYEYPRVPFHRYIPSASFNMWVHKKSNVTYTGYKYQRQWISQEYRFDWDRSPWLYNSCRNSISTISNYCSLDPRKDMQYKDFYYLVNEDKVVGNIYCKKSSAKVWDRIGTFEFVRKK